MENEIKKISLDFLKNFIKKIENDEIEVGLLSNNDAYRNPNIRDGLKEILIQYKEL